MAAIFGSFKAGADLVSGSEEETLAARPGDDVIDTPHSIPFLATQKFLL